MKQTLFLFSLSLLLLAPPTLSAQDENRASELFSESLELAESGNLPAAILLMDSAIRLNPDSPNAYWNLGIWYGEVGEYIKALETWRKYRSLEPDDWQGRAKVIQTCQALGDTACREKEREELFTLWESGTDSALSSKEMYCRDQFSVGTMKVFAFETFAPSGDRMIFYTFYPFDSSGNAASRFSLGSYEMTTQMARDVGEIAEDERIYHLDEYGGSNYSHATWGMYGFKPSYEEVKGFVSAALEWQNKPMSSSSPVRTETEEEEK